MAEPGKRKTRKAKADDGGGSAAISLRITADEKRKLEADAAAANLDLSALIRNRISAPSKTPEANLMFERLERLFIGLDNLVETMAAEAEKDRIKRRKNEQDLSRILSRLEPITEAWKLIDIRLENVGKIASEMQRENELSLARRDRMIGLLVAMERRAENHENLTQRLVAAYEFLGNALSQGGGK